VNQQDRDLSAAQPHEVGLSTEGLDRVDAVVRELVDQGALAGAVTLTARRGQLVRLIAMGKQNLATGAPMREDSIFRIFSMTKPVTATAMMILHDEGRWQPQDPIAKHLPEFEGIRVVSSFNADGSAETEPAAHAPTMLELMTHTAGFGYGFMPIAPIDALYAKAGIWKSTHLAEFSRRVASVPLAYQPGTKWEYSLSMDLQGAIIERLTGQALPDFMRERIFEPLGMKDTAFHTPPEKVHRRCEIYFSDRNSPPMPFRASPIPDYAQVPSFALGGGGLVSTAPDYARFAQMLLNGGALAGKRIVSAAAVRQQMSNWLPDEIINGGYAAGYQRIRPGFGYGYNGVVFTDPALAGVPVGKGTYHWDGAGGTWFWVDPSNDLLYIGMIQMLLSEASLPLQAMTQTLMAEAILD